MWIINRLQIRRWHLVLPFKTILSIHVFNGKNTHVFNNFIVRSNMKSTSVVSQWCTAKKEAINMCPIFKISIHVLINVMNIRYIYINYILNEASLMTFMEFYWKSVLYGLECNIFIIFDVALTEAHDDYGSQGIRVVFRYTKAFVCIIMLVCN